MATSPILLPQLPKLKWKNPSIHLSLTSSSLPHLKIPKISKNLTIKCLLTNKTAPISHKDIKINENPVEIMAKSIIKALKALQKPAAAAILVGLLLIYDPSSVLAASGGRMGGNSFSSSRSSMSSSSRSYSAPRMSGGGSGLTYSAPFYAPSPFSGVYVGPAVGVGSSFFLVFVAFAAFVLVSGFLSEGGGGGSVLTDTEKTSVIKMQVGLLGLGRSLQKDLNRIAEIADTSTSDGLHFVLTGNMSHQDVTASEDVSCYILDAVVPRITSTQTMLALLRHPDYCISAYSSIDVKRSMEEGEKRFNQLSVEERGKFDEETLVNVNNIKKQSSTMLRSSGFSNEYIVVTILVAAGGVHKLPSINSSKDLKEALQKLASIPSSRTLAVEVLWTPQNEDDTLSERELLEDYPLLRPL